jgi:O-antigen/teichoic acid export membrane protein
MQAPDKEQTVTVGPPAAGCEVCAEAAPPPPDVRGKANLGSALRGASVTLTSSLVSIGIGVVTNIAMARLMGPEYKGRVDLINSTIGLSSTVVGSALGMGVTYVVAKGRLNQRRLAAIMVLVAVVQGVLTVCGLNLVARTPLIKALIPEPYVPWAVPVLGAGTGGALLLVYWRFFLYGLQRVSLSALLDVGGKFLTAALMISAAVALRGRPDTAAAAAIVGIVVALLVMAIVAGAVLFRQLVPGGQGSGFLEVCKYTVPCYLGHLVQSLNYRLDVFLIAFYVGDRAVGVYVIAVAVGQLLWLPSQAMQPVIFPRLAAMTDPAERAEHTAQVARLLLAMTALMSVGVAMFGPWAVVLLFGQAFAPSVVPLWALLPGITVYSAANILASFLGAIGRPSLNLAIASVALVPTLGLNILLLPRIGILGAAIASSVSYTMTTLLSVWIFCSKTRLRPWTALLIRAEDLRAITTWARTFCARMTR